VQTKVLTNFVGNAAKFTESGRIVCRAAPASSGSGLRLEVVDTGPGLAPEQIDRMFEPFERGGAARNEQIGGAGLGLAISRRFVDLMGGRIGLESRLGEGTTAFVEVDLPRVPEPAPRDGTPAAHDPAGGRRLRVLVAEDTPTSQLVIRSLLERRGHWVQIVANGAEAVEAARDGAFDLVLLDMQMPIMGGLEAAERIVALPQCAGVPVVALTAQAQPEMKREALAAGMIDYIVKPVQPATLDGVLARVASGRVASGRVAPARIAAPTAAETRPDLDRTLLDDLRQSLGTAGVRAVVTQFESDVEALLGRLRAETADRDALRAVAHKLAGLFAQFGAQQASGLARGLEETSRTAADPAAVETLIAEGKRALDAVKDHFIR
jgi:CheY-like chemotaxis protein